MLWNGVHYSRSELLVINKNITKINEELKDYSRTMDSMYIVEHPQFVSSLGVTNESLLAEDGLHLSIEGTEVTVQNIESAIMEVCRDSFSIITSSAMNETPVTSEVVRDPLNADKLFFSDLRLCFRTCKNPGFSQRGSYHFMENLLKTYLRIMKVKRCSS